VEAAVLRSKRVEQSAQVKKPLIKPNAVYFDTNPILGAGWPHPSVQLLQVISQSENLGFSVCIPEVVSTELEEHIIRELNGEWRKANSQIDTLNRRGHSLVAFPKLGSLPPYDDLRSALRQLVATFTQRFRLVPVTKRPLSEFLNLAILRGATFEQGGRGFQDAVILCSVLDDMKANNFANAIFVSGDKAFQSDGTAQLQRESGIELEVVVSLDDLERLLGLHFSSAWRELVERDRKELIDTLNPRLVEIEHCLINNLTFTPDELNNRGAIKRIESLKVISIANVHSTFGLAEEDEPGDQNRVKVSMDVNFRLVLSVQPCSEREKVKVGEFVEGVTLASILRAAQIEITDYEAVAVVEADATKSGTGYSDIQFTSAHLKQREFDSGSMSFSFPITGAAYD